MSKRIANGMVVYTLGLRNDCQTVIGRIKHGLEHATFPFHDCVFGKEPWPDGIDPLDKDLIMRATHLIWTDDGCWHTDGFDNETDGFLDAIGIPKRERGSLIRVVRDCGGMVCKHCGLVGHNRKYKSDTGTWFFVYPDGTQVCNDCESGIECGAGPREWRGDKK